MGRLSSFWKAPRTNRAQGGKEKAHMQEKRTSITAEGAAQQTHSQWVQRRMIESIYDDLDVGAMG